MGFWSRLFPSDADRVKRARELIEQGKFEEARGLLFNVQGDEAERLYNQASDLIAGPASPPRRPAKTPQPLKPPPDPIVFEPLQADGTQRFKFGGQAVEFNAPRQEAEVPFSNDPLEIALAIVDHYRRQKLGTRGEFTFIEAVWLLTKHSARLPELADPARAALAQLTAAAAESDPERALSVCSSGSRSQDQATVTAYVDALLSARFPKQVAAHVLANEAASITGIQLMAALGESEPDQCLRLIELEPDPRLARSFLLEALLASIDAGHRSAALSERWAALAPDCDESEHLEAEVRLSSRDDLERAGAAWRQLVDGPGETSVATEAYLARLAKVDAARALKLAVCEERSGFDDLPRVLSCHLGGLDVSQVLDDYIESLTAYAYRPFEHFALLVELSVRLEDKARLQRTLERGGPAGWQVAIAAREAVRILAARGSSELPSLIDICSSSYEPGIVAGRDASAGGLHAGHVVFRSEWLAFSRPRPVETLRIIARLGEDGPRWGSDRLA